MLKNILKLAGAVELSKHDQKSMNGSGPLKPSKGCCNPANDCCTPCPTAECPGWGNSSCQFLYTTGGFCCI